MTIRFHRGDLPADYIAGPSIAIDTETLGLNPHRDRLCVVQISRGDGSADVVQIFPLPVLGVLLLFEALSLATLLRDISGSRADLLVALLVVWVASVGWAGWVGLVAWARSA